MYHLLIMVIYEVTELICEESAADYTRFNFT